MLKPKLILLFLVTFSFTNIYSQEEFEYFGAIKLNDTSVITYTINFKEVKGEIKGYSITDLGGEHETRSLLFGEYSEANKELSFRETAIVYTKSTYKHDDFCHINFTTKNYKLGDNKISGKFIGLFSDNTRCIDGEILLNESEKVEKRVAKVTKKIDRMKRIPDSIKQRANMTKIMDSLKMNILRSDKTLNLFSNSNTINVAIYDGGQEDGDIIDVYVDNKLVLKNYTVSKTPKKLPVSLINKQTYLKIVAKNVGTISTNTAVLELSNNSYTVRALTNLKVNEKTTIAIIKN
jgi:hypothetical protein